MPRLGVNVDHIATVRQARQGIRPDPIEAALQAQRAGAHGIVAHLREDRRHIQDRDITLLAAKVRRLDLEMAATVEMVQRAVQHRPALVTVVPERRQELTTESGLNVQKQLRILRRRLQPLFNARIPVALFVDPDPEQIRAAVDLGIEIIELNTGRYSEAKTQSKRKRELHRIHQAVVLCKEKGLRVNAGHGLDYDNVVPVARIPEIEEFNIGFSIVSRAVFVGIQTAVREMIDLLHSARKLSL
ncbi:MAG: pyridoxine 5'-phosphate synthase [Deltaproteobacteria bacterium]|nr:pyridoxine 5'-phosphate synthase [Deltaproteobacteria bacterium]